MISPHERQEKIIRATDLDALSCRYSANNKSYFVPSDPYINTLISSYQSYLQYCSGYTNLSARRTLKSVFNEQKLPLINRGTYLRTKSIDLVINEFIEQFNKCQIISLGGGSDTRCFRLLQNSDVTYHEIDFPESIKIKKLAILGNQTLKKIVNYKEDANAQVKSKDQLFNFESDLHTDKYHLYGYDLRQLTDEKGLSNFSELIEYIDPTLPTIVLSECVLCYLSPKENEKIIKFWTKVFQDSSNVLSFLIYEPMSLNDAFGTTMTQNLSNRGINLLTFSHFPTLESRFKFLSKTCGLRNIKLTDMSDIGGYSSHTDNYKPWIDSKEMSKINRLELIDEIEEIRLLLKHYCLCYGEYSKNEKSSFERINKWNWLIE